LHVHVPQLGNRGVQMRQRLQSSVKPRPAWSTLSRVTCPTLVLWGMQSDLLSEQQARRMVEALPCGELVSVPDVGHAPTLVEPAAFTALERFLPRVTQREQAAPQS
jgi:pimeloyl-ACP methyl ester carboxylesterase